MAVPSFAINGPVATGQSAKASEERKVLEVNVAKQKELLDTYAKLRKNIEEFIRFAHTKPEKSMKVYATNQDLQEQLEHFEKGVSEKSSGT